MEENFFGQVVIPILGPAQTSLIAISTTKGNENYFSKMLNMSREDGKPFFTTFKFYLACEKCRRDRNVSECKHMYHLLPHWQVGYKQELLRQMYKELGMTELMVQETIGKYS